MMSHLNERMVIIYIIITYVISCLSCSIANVLYIIDVFVKRKADVSWEQANLYMKT